MLKHSLCVAVCVLTNACVDQLPTFDDLKGWSDASVEVRADRARGGRRMAQPPGVPASGIPGTDATISPPSPESSRSAADAGAEDEVRAPLGQQSSAAADAGAEDEVLAPSAAEPSGAAAASSEVDELGDVSAPHGPAAGAGGAGADRAADDDASDL